MATYGRHLQKFFQQSPLVVQFGGDFARLKEWRTNPYFGPLPPQVVGSGEEKPEDEEGFVVGVDSDIGRTCWLINDLYGAPDVVIDARDDRKAVLFHEMYRIMKCPGVYIMENTRKRKDGEDLLMEQIVQISSWWKAGGPGYTARFTHGIHVYSDVAVFEKRVVEDPRKWGTG